MELETDFSLSSMGQNPDYYFQSLKRLRQNGVRLFLKEHSFHFHGSHLLWLTPYPSVLDCWKIKFEKSSSTNWIFNLQQSISKLIFAGYTGSENPVWKRIKFKFVELDFSRIKYRWIGRQCSWLSNEQTCAVILLLKHLDFIPNWSFANVNSWRNSQPCAFILDCALIRESIFTWI